MSKLILKVVRDDMTSHAGFVWPASGPVAPATWDPTPRCGNGLHGWLGGEGKFRHSFMDGKWIVFRAEEVVVLDDGDKCKTGPAEVLFVGTRADAVKYLIDNGALTAESDPGWCCFTNTQLCELAYRSANRALHTHAPRALRAAKQEGLAVRMEAISPITDRQTAVEARREANEVRYAAADAAAYAAAADAAADAAAADAAAAAADAAYAVAYAVAYAAVAYAADAADADAAAAAAAAAAADAYAAAAAADAAYAAAADAAAAAAAAACKAEGEAQRQDRLELLGLITR